MFYVLKQSYIEVTLILIKLINLVNVVNLNKLIEMVLIEIDEFVESPDWSIFFLKELFSRASSGFTVRAFL